MGALVFLLILIAVVVFLFIGMYNSLITLRNHCDNAWSQVDVQLRRRYDLIPNLVETVKGYAKHESGVFEKVTQARAAAVNARQFYNDSVMKFNMRQQVFPSNIIANMFNFKPRDYFQIEEAVARGPVKVSF
jgi:LemA protein